MDLGDDLRRGQVEEIGIALDVVRMVAEALAPILLLREAATMDEDTPRPVEHEDSLREERLHVCAGVFHEFGSRLRGREPEGSRGSLGVW